MNCANCGTENRSSSKFCRNCGSPLARTCPNCGTAVAPDATFCDECGTRLEAAAAAPAPRPAPATPAPATERKLVSILFADLVGFTAASERRDAEEVRELLTRYFDACRRLVGLYGGSIEKFIGDAVMAVWGTPVANEDDAERAVRAALDVVAAVEALGAEVGLPDLRARAAVLTGEAAVTIGATGQGMVAGDLVNSASRVQSLASPGTVLVGEATRRATEAALVYEDAGAHEVKGKVEPIHVWRALRAVGGARGQLKSEGLEPPFVGRDRELRLIKELFHGSADEARAHLVSAVGIAGIGKSRLTWEFYKYIDGLASLVYWQRGRCLSYGEGVTYWALADMVRMRCRIEEAETGESAQAKLRAVLDEHVTDPEERTWVEPRIAHLLGLEERAASWDRQDLFGAWRLFFERLAEHNPTVLVFEDMQWADSALVDFIEHLLEWSRNQRLFVLTLARPEFMDRYPEWGAGKRNFTSLYLEPLSPAAMEDLLSGLVPGLPDELSRQVLERAEGVPLYAVETIRMLLDRGVLTRGASGYQVSGAVGRLEVPESLQALIAARLDGLEPDERRLVQQAAVLGKTFTVQAIAELSGDDSTLIEPLLSSLVRKELLSIQLDPRSPEHGQYGFLQDLVRKVAYDTLAKRERKALHLQAAEQLLSERGGEEEDLAQVIASHLLNAYETAPDADDAEEIKVRAVAMLSRAGERAASLAANEEAQRYFERAAELTADRPDRARLLDRAGQAAWLRAKSEDAHRLLDEAHAILSDEGDLHGAARIAARIGEIDWRRGRVEDAFERMENALDVLAGEEADPDVAAVAASLARIYVFTGDMEKAMSRAEIALEHAERLGLSETIADGLNNKAILLQLLKERHVEAEGLLRHALHVATENDLPIVRVRSQSNLADTLQRIDDFAGAEEQLRSALAIARKVGYANGEAFVLSELVTILYMIGRWDEALETRKLIPPASSTQGWPPSIAGLLIARGQVADARSLCEPAVAAFRESADLQDRTLYEATEAALLLAEGRPRDALDVARTLLARSPSSLRGWDTLTGYELALQAAFGLGDFELMEELIAWSNGLYRGRINRTGVASTRRFQGRLAAARGESSAEEHFAAAIRLYREIRTPFNLARTLLELAEWLGDDRATAPLLAEARTIFEDLKAGPWLDRVAQAEARSSSATVST